MYAVFLRGDWGDRGESKGTYRHLLRQKSDRFVQGSYAWMIRSDLTLLYLAMIEENGANKVGVAAAIS